MANQYTGEAYMGVELVKTDFGAIGMNAFNIDAAMKAQELETAKYYTKIAADKRKQLDADLKEFDKLATEAKNLSPQAFDSQSLSILVAHTQNEIADMRRELADPNITTIRKSEIMTKVGDMKNKAASYTNQMKSFQEFLGTLSKVGKGGYDDIMNAPLIADINSAIIGAGREGVKDLGNGVFSMGKGIDFTYRDGMLVYSIKDRNGNSIAEGSPAELQAKLGSLMKPYVDLDSMMDSSGKLIGNSIIKGFKRNPDGTIINTETTNHRDIANKAARIWDERYGKTFDTDPYMQKGVIAGRWSTPEEARQAFVDAVLASSDSVIKQSLQSDPAYGGSGSRANNNPDPGLTAIQGALNGQEEYIQKFVGAKLPMYVNDNGVNRQAQLAGVRSGEDAVTLDFLGMTGKKNDKTYSEPFSITFEKTAEGQQQAAGILGQIWNSYAQTKEKLHDVDYENFNFNQPAGYRTQMIDENGQPMFDENRNPVYLPGARDISNELTGIVNNIENYNQPGSKITLQNDVKGIFDKYNILGLLKAEAGMTTGWFGGKTLTLRDKETGDELLSFDMSSKPSIIKSIQENMPIIIDLIQQGSAKRRKNNPRFYSPGNQQTQNRGSVMDMIRKPNL
jgi:hypothetical protein|nr:MAG TPA: hypothetical protein [Crassvirales sp.]